MKTPAFGKARVPMDSPKQGDIFLVDLEPALSGEADKIRPAVIVSNNANNEFAPTVTVVPLTSNTRKLYPFQVFLTRETTKLDFHSKAQAEQVRTVSKRRLERRIGRIGRDDILSIQRALRLHFAMD